MLRVHFSSEDLLRVTLAHGPAPLVELGLAVAALQRSDLPPALAHWQQTARRSLPRAARPFLSLIPPSAHGPLFLDPPVQDFDAAIDQMRSTSPADVRAQLDMAQTAAGRPVTRWARQLGEQDRAAWSVLTSALRTTYDALIAPAWPRIAAGYDAEYACRSRFLTQHGVRATLSGIAPGARWRGTTLEIPRPKKTDVTLNGRGLTLLPSMVWAAYPLVCFLESGGPALLVYPALSPLPLLDAPGGTDPLAALLGTTRAAVLRLLTVERTTGDVAVDLGIANSSASEHAKALRAARLVTSRREGKTMRHQCTPLGLDLLTGGPEPTPSHGGRSAFEPLPGTAVGGWTEVPEPTDPPG